MTRETDRCRLVLVATLDEGDAAVAAVEAALSGGDVASVIVAQGDLDIDQFQQLAERLVPAIQAAGAAALIAGDSRVAGRVKADGLHVEGSAGEIAEAVEKFTPRLIVGAGGADDRHEALEIGELRLDYIFFGRLDGDNRPEAHPKNLALGEWWSSLVEIPCIVMGGSDLESALAVAESGAEFVALSRAVFSHIDGPREAVALINAALDEKAPRFQV